MLRGSVVQNHSGRFHRRARLTGGDGGEWEFGSGEQQAEKAQLRPVIISKRAQITLSTEKVKVASEEPAMC
ncbi:unnamed protein product [Lota lota]